VSKNDFGRWLLLIAFLFSIFNFQIQASAATIDREYVEKLFLEEKYDRAAVEAGKLIDENASRRDELYYIKGLSEIKMGKLAEARKDFEYIIERYSGSKRLFDAHVGIGDAYLLEGNKTGALRSYNAALEEFPDNKNIAVVRQRIDSCRSGVTVATPVSYTKEDTIVYPPQKAEARISPRAEDVNFTPKAILPASVKGGGYFSVQVGSFKSMVNAQKLSTKLSRKGYESRVELPIDPKDKLYRVKVARLTSSREADILELKLKREGYPTRICRED
jgi:tetratricopeptide (TPR) repeat protein